MFLNNKYSRWYFNITTKANSQVRKKNENDYFESHHVVPSCLGGNNDKQNQILLTAKEHYICHLLLVKMTTGKAKSKMYNAFRIMSGKTKKHKRYTSRLHSFFREKLSQAYSGPNHPMFGRKHSDETKKKMKEAKQNFHHMRGKFGKLSHRYGMKHSEEVRKKISRAGVNHPSYGTKMSNETKKKISISRNKTYTITNPNGNIEITKNLKEYCDMNNIGYAWLINNKSNKGYSIINS